jgi:rhamnogalacturonyl hydrolase YesR
MQRAAQKLGNSDADQFVLKHNLICARYYHWLAGLENQSGNAATNFTYTTKIKGLMTLGSLDNCGAMGSEMIESMINHPNQTSSGEQEVIRRISDWVVHRQARLPDGTFWRPRRMGGTVWPDDLYMGGEFLVQEGIYTRDQRLIDDAAEQIIHQAALEQDRDGLWFHGYFVAQKRHAPFKWGRGNGWAIVTIVETLSAMPKDDTLRPALLAILRRQIAGLKKVQAPDGMWRQVLDQPDMWEETSCTAMFAYGIARAANRGWIAPENMLLARKAFQAIASHVGPDGAVHGTCEGTDIGMDLSYYLNRRRPEDEPHGRGPVMLAGIEILSAPER